jgi:sterol desaturase/sphingolipid hydroxylase (fatty acid hydroxylase superfamily)
MMWKIIIESGALVLLSACFHTHPCSALRIVTQHRPGVGVCLVQPLKYPSRLPQSPLESSLLSRKVTVKGSSLILDNDNAATMEDDPRTRISTTQFRKHVTIVRMVTLAVVGLFVRNFQTADVLVQGAYASLKTVRFFRHFAFEPLLASFCFLFYISYYAIIDFFVPPLWKYRIQPAGPVGDTMLAWKDRLRDALSFEVPLYLGVWIPFGGIVKARKIQETTSLALVSREVVLALIIYDTLFYFGHWILHRNSFLFQNVHGKHHRMDVVRAGDSIRHSFLDGFWDVVCAVIALNVLKANALSRAVFNIVAIGLIVEAHSGMNLPWAAANVVPFPIMAGPVAHDDHHRKGYGNYSKFFSWWDALFATRLKEKLV